MNKLTTSIIAAAAGTTLILGGGSTLAGWNSGTFTSLAATISAGNLKLSTPTAGVWTDQTGTTTTPASFRIAPGDTLTYQTTLDLTANGDNLRGQITLDPASIGPANPAKPEDIALAALLMKSATVTIDGRADTHFTAKQGTQALRVTTILAWPDGTTATDNAAQRGSIVLTDLTFTVTQTLP